MEEVGKFYADNMAVFAFAFSKRSSPPEEKYAVNLQENTHADV